jgi:hypothetical protein
MEFSNLYEELESITKIKLSEETVEWKANAIGDEINMGDRDYFPIERCEEFEAPEERVMAHSKCIQQVNLEIDEEEMQQSILQRRI